MTSLYDLAESPAAAQRPATPLEVGHSRANDAADHADCESEGWTDQAIGLARRFLREGRMPFVASEVVEFAESRGCPAPPDRRAWGAIMKRLSLSKEIVPTGRHVRSPQAAQHGAPVREWTRNSADTPLAVPTEGRG